MIGRARKRGRDKYRWRRRILKLAVLLIFLVVGLYNLLTGSWFITKVVFPFLSDRIGYNLAADKVDMSLLHAHLKIINFRFGPGWDPIVNAPQIDCDFSRRAMWRGRIALANVVLESPEAAVSRNQAGFYNVNRIHRTPRRPSPPGPVVFPPEPEFYLSAKNIKVRNGSFRLDYIDSDGDNDISLYVKEVAIDADSFENGGLTNFSLNAHGRMSTYSLDMSDFKISLSCHAGFTKHLLPCLAQAETTIFDIAGNAGGVDLAQRTIHASGEASGENVLNALTVKSIEAEIARTDGNIASKISVSGDLDFYPWHMTAKANAARVDSELFNYFHNYLGVPLQSTAMTTANTFKLDYQTAELDGTLAFLADPATAEFEYMAQWKLADKELVCNHFAASVTGTGSAVIELKNEFAVGFDGGKAKLHTTPTIKFTAENLRLLRCMRCFNIEPSWNPGILNAVFNCAFAPDLSAFSLSGSGALSGVLPTTSTHPIDANFDLTGSIALNGILKVGSLNSNINIGKTGPAQLHVSNAVFDLSGGDSQFTLQTESISHRLFDLKPKTTAILHELGDPLLRFDGQFTYSPRKKTLAFSGVKAEFTGAGAPHPRIEVDDNIWLTEPGVFAKPLHASVSLPEYTLPGSLNLSFGTLTGGKWSFQSGTLNASENLESLEFSGGIHADNTELKMAGLRFPALGISAAPQLKLDQNGLELDLKSFQASLNSSEAFDMRMCLIHKIDGSTHASGTIEKCTGAMLPPFGIKPRAPLMASGEFELDFISATDFRYRGAFTAQTTLSGRSKNHVVTIAGLLNLGADNTGLSLTNAELDFTTASEMLGNLKISGFLPPAGTPDRVFHLLVRSNRLDAENVFSLVDDARDRKLEPVITFGNIPLIADVNFKDIIWGNMQANLTGRLCAVNRELALERIFLRLNGAEMRLNGKLSGSKEKTGYQFEAISDDAEAAALLSPFLPDIHQFKATVRHARLNISGDSLAKSGFWDTMTGKLDVDLEAISLSHSLGETVPGRVLLLPFSIIANLPEILPTSRSRIERLAEVIPLFTRFYQNTGAVEFEKGHMALSAAGKGRINIDDFVLTGSPIERFTFTGYLGFGSDRSVKLCSMVKLTSGLLIPVDIYGTLDNPQVDYSAIASGVISANTWGRFNDK